MKIATLVNVRGMRSIVIITKNIQNQMHERKWGSAQTYTRIEVHNASRSGAHTGMPGTHAAAGSRSLTCSLCRWRCGIPMSGRGPAPRGRALAEGRRPDQAWLHWRQGTLGNVQSYRKLHCLIVIYLIDSSSISICKITSGNPMPLPTFFTHTGPEKFITKRDTTEK